jgi:hypothetical protein
LKHGFLIFVSVVKIIDERFWKGPAVFKIIEDVKKNDERNDWFEFQVPMLAELMKLRN